ncbi:hypothetical protein BJ508DRAFT_62066 [Ascobolus immersus RN42]|uniref:Uncharacterized protein n=1 Tax=Ascobolus immersus RN42 TaxID=1160509 RepID=A0A3N4IN65_ASCIM|nr:hypothetical protein BJ508DRAFT_62066 [Ascobolus immersus RN42]
MFSLLFVYLFSVAIAFAVFPYHIVVSVPRPTASGPFLVLLLIILLSSIACFNPFMFISSSFSLILIILPSPVYLSFASKFSSWSMDYLCLFFLSLVRIASRVRVPTMESRCMYLYLLVNI